MTSQDIKILRTMKNYYYCHCNCYCALQIIRGPMVTSESALRQNVQFYKETVTNVTKLKKSATMAQHKFHTTRL